MTRLESGIKTNSEKINTNYGIFEEEVKRLDDKNEQFSTDVSEKHEYIKDLIATTESNLNKEIADSCATVKEYCRSNTEEINNNITEFKEAVHVANVELDNKIVGCGKDLERCRSDFQANLEKSFNELDDVVQSLATGEIADSVREIASFRTKIKDIGSKVKRENIVYCVVKIGRSADQVVRLFHSFYLLALKRSDRNAKPLVAIFPSF